jgi:hypothetical protein
VRRGDKLLTPNQFPNLNALTQPNAIAKSLLENGVSKYSEVVYLATDEVQPHFFDTLKNTFIVKTLYDLIEEDDKFRKLLELPTSHCIQQQNSNSKPRRRDANRSLQSRVSMEYISNQNKPVLCPPLIVLADYSLFINAPNKRIDTYVDTVGITGSLTALKRKGVGH